MFKLLVIITSVGTYNPHPSSMTNFTLSGFQTRYECHTTLATIIKDFSMRANLRLYAKSIEYIENFRRDVYVRGSCIKQPGD